MAKLNKTECMQFAVRIHSLYIQKVQEFNKTIEEKPEIEKATEKMKQSKLFKKINKLQEMFDERYKEAELLREVILAVLPNHSYIDRGVRTNLYRNWKAELLHHAKNQELKNNGYIFKTFTQEQVFGYVILQMYTNKDINRAEEIATSIYNGEIDLTNY